MSTAVNHFKLGLFVLAGLAAATASAAAAGARAAHGATIHYHTFFNESVQGLDVGSPVKYRGVTIGVVSEIEIARDHRHVDVEEELAVRSLRRLGLVEEAEGPPRFVIPSDLRAQLGSQGITGVKFVAIDFFDEKSNPLPELPFATPKHYIPAAASLMKTLEDAALRTLDKLPDVADSVDHVLKRIDAQLEQLGDKRLPEKMSVALDDADAALKDLRQVLDRAKANGLADKSGKALDDIHVAVERLNAILDRVGGDNGLVAGAGRAVDAFYGLSKSTNGRTKDLSGTLRDVDEAAQAIRDLAEELERDPDMLIKGKAKARTP